MLSIIKFYLQNKKMIVFIFLNYSILIILGFYSIWCERGDLNSHSHKTTTPSK